MRIDTATFSRHNAELQKEPRFAFALSFDTANTVLWWFTSHSDTALPGGGGTTTSVLARLSGTSQVLTPDQANATIGNIDLDVVDKDSAITALLNSELALGRSTRQQRIQVYMGYKGDLWTDYTLIQTQLVFEIAYLEGKYTLRCQDVQRAMRKDIFLQATTQMAATLAANTLTLSCAAAATVLTLDDTTNFPNSGSGLIRDTVSNDNDSFTWTGKSGNTLTGCSGVLAHSAGATVCDAVVNVVDTTKFTAVAHGTSYSDAPSATVGYIKIEDEVCRWIGKTSTTFTLDQRGALNTVVSPHVVDAASTLDTRMPATEYIYLELPAVDLMYRLLTGRDRLGNVVLPTNWNLGISTTYVRLSDYTGIGKDLWDTTDDSQGFIVRFEDLQKTDGKKFIETELALLLGVFMPVYADGALGCKRMANLLSGAAYVAVLDSSNVVSCGELTHDFNSLHNVIQISWNYEPSQRDFTRVNIFLDQPSITIHGQAPTLKLAFRGLHGSRHSASMLATRFDMIRDRYTGPPQRITTQVLHRFNSLEVGDVVRHNVRTVRDFVTGAQLDRSMEVQGINIDWVRGNLSLQLFGSSRAPTPLPATGDATVISDPWYSSQGTQVVNGTGGLTLSGSNPIHISGTGTLAGNADMTNAGAIYYLTGDVQIDAGAVVNITQNVQLRVKGNLQNNGTITGRGAGIPGAAALASGGDVTYYGVTSNTQALGTAGFLGATEAGGGVQTNTGTGTIYNDRTNFIIAIRSAIVRGLNLVIPSFNITWNGAALIGIPTDLRGTSGSSGMSTGTGNLGLIGGAGGNGGAGLMVVSRGLSQGAAGKIDLSGGDGLAGQDARSFLPNLNNTTWGGSGAGGAPGGLAVFLDGAGFAATGLTDAGFVALYGKTPVQPYVMPNITDHAVLADNSSLSKSFYSFFVGTGDGTVGNGGASSMPLPNLSGARGGSRVQFVPGNQTIQADPGSSALVAPTSMGLTSTAAELLLTGFGVALSRIKVTWVPAPGDISGYDIQFKLSTDSVWQSAPPVLGQSSNTAYLMGVIAGQQYDVRLRSAGATREVSAWITITNFPVFNQLASPPANVTGFSASQTGVVVSFNWDQVSDYALKGYDIGFAPQGITDWNLFTPLTEVAKGTEMTNASVPPGTWVFGIRARNLADQLSTTPAFFNLVVVNANPTISQVAQERDWLGVKVNFIQHYTGVLVPLGLNNVSTYTRVNPPSAPILGTTPGGTLALTTYFVKITYVTASGGETTPSAEASQIILLNNLLTVASPGASSPATAYNVYVSATTNTETKQNATPIPLGTNWTEPASGLLTGSALPSRNGTGFEPFDVFVPDPVSSASYTATQVDIGYDDSVRVFAVEAATMGPGQSGTPGLGLAVDTWLSAGSDLGVFTPWVLGTILMRFLKARLTLNGIVAGAVSYVTSFIPTIDKAPVIEHADSVVIGATGTAITFPTPFHVIPNVQVTPISAGVTSASATSVTTTGFTAHVFNGGTEVGGTINWVANGE